MPLLTRCCLSCNIGIIENLANLESVVPVSRMYFVCCLLPFKGLDGLALLEQCLFDIVEMICWAVTN